MYLSTQSSSFWPKEKPKIAAEVIRYHWAIQYPVELQMQF